MQFGDNLTDPVTHGPPIIDGVAHVGQDPSQIRLEPGQGLGFALSIDFDMHIAFAEPVDDLAGQTQVEQAAGSIAPGRQHRMNHRDECRGRAGSAPG